jgi:hypothetical protein
VPGWVLIPVAVYRLLGVILVVSSVATLTAPFWVETWKIGSGEVSSRFAVFGSGRTLRFKTSQVGWIELRRNVFRLGFPWISFRSPQYTPYALVFVNREKDDLIVIHGLTVGEGRWMGGRFRELLTEVPQRNSKAIESASPDPLWDRELDR